MLFTHYIYNLATVYFTAQTARFHMNPDYGNVLEGPFFHDFFVRDGLYMFGKAVYDMLMV